MTERGILFSAPMVRAIVAGAKSQTRRIINPQPIPAPILNGWNWIHGRTACGWTVGYSAHPAMLERCPYGKAGDFLWVRETRWRNGGFVATDPPNIVNEGKMPAIHMPRSASRLTLEITRVRAEQVQAITNEDAIAEGRTDARAFGLLWDDINGKRAPWVSNPWVWVLDFRVVVLLGRRVIPAMPGSACPHALSGGVWCGLCRETV